MNYGVCECFSVWAAHLRQTHTDGKCPQCVKRVILKRRSTRKLTLFVPCDEEVDAVHGLCIALHKRCVPAFEASYQSKRRNLLYVRFDMLLDEIPNAWRQQLIDTCLKNHSLVMSRCGSCGAYEQEHVRFDHCASCQSVSYCDEECQLEHWPRHREFCAQRQLSVALASVGPQQENAESDNMCCLSAKMHAFKLREKTLLCSNPQCDRIAHLPHMPTTFLATCKTNRGETHRVATHFCNIVCQKDSSLLE